MHYQNFAVSAAKGKLYLKAKVAVDGYEQVRYGTNNDKITFHKYFDSIRGMPTNLEVKEFAYEGKKLVTLELTLTDINTQNKVSVNLKNTKGSYSDEAKTLISALYGLKLGQEVTLTTKKTTYTTKAGESKSQLAIYINYVNILGANGKGESTGFIPYTEIPRAIPVDDGMGSKTWDWKPVNIFFTEKLNEIKSRFEAPLPMAAKGAVVAAAADYPDPNNFGLVEGDSDDLPF